VASRISPYLTSAAREKTSEQLQANNGSVMNPNDHLGMQTSFERDAKEIKSIDSGRKLSEVRELIAGVKLKWSGVSGPYYSLLMLDACKTLNSVDLGDKGQYELAYANAMEILGQPDRLPQEPAQRFDTETGLVMCLNRDLGDSSWNVSQTWELRRRSNAEKFLSLWQRIKNETDPTFDFEKKPFINVPPPIGSGVSAGADPALIKDPAKRAAYEAALRANQERANAYNLQRRLRALAETFQPHLKGYLTAAYAKAPANSSELEELLSRYHVDDSLKADIMKSLDGNVGKN
jgi:hypothetical protein